MSVKKIFFKIHKDLVAGNLNLPTLTQVSLQIRKAAANPNADVRLLTKVTETDPVFCGYLLQIANSPLYRGRVDIQKVNLAIARLGIKATCNIATNYAIRALYTKQRSNMTRHLKNIWRYSTYTAAVAGVIAEYIPHSFDPEEAILAGLLQDIGCLPLIEKASQYPEILENDKYMMFLFDRYAGNIGSSILRKWGLHEKFIDVVKNRDQWEYNDFDEVNLTDLVLIAKMHAYLGKKRLKPVPKINQVPSFFKLQLETQLSPERSLQFIVNAKQKIAETQRTLGG